MQRRGSPAVDRVRLYPSIRTPRPVAALFHQPARDGIQPFPSRGVGGGKSPSRMGYGSLLSRKIWHSQKNVRYLRTELIEQSLGVLQIGGIEAFGEPVVDVGEHHARLIATALRGEQAAQAYHRP